MVEVKEVSFSYGDEMALDQVSLTLKEGDFFSLFGKDDAGKTTLINIVMGFITNYSGSAQLFGKNANNLTSCERSQVRYVPDSVVLENMAVSQYFNMWEPMSPRYDKQWQAELCDLFGVPNKSFLEMTYNENKSAQLIGAICAKPELLILDEPGNFLNDNNYTLLLRILKRLNGQGMSILLATETYADTRGCCTVYAYMKEGKIIQCGDIPYPEHRWKVVTIEKIEDSTDKEIKNIYIYKKEMEKLPDILLKSGGSDFTIEEMTFEEEIDMDFSRWKGSI